MDLMAAEQRRSKEPICVKHKLKRLGMSAFRWARSNGSALLSLWSDTILCQCKNGSKHAHGLDGENSSGCKHWHQMPKCPNKKKEKRKEYYWKAPKLYICKTWQISLGSLLLYDKLLRRLPLDSFRSLEKLQFELISGCELENLIEIWASHLSPVMLHCSGFLIFLSLKQSCIISQTLSACVRIITVTLLNGPLGVYSSFFFGTFCFQYSGALATFHRFTIISLLAD